MIDCNNPLEGSQNYSTPARVLIVDDDPNTRELYTMVLAGAGYRSDAAENGASAWRLLSNAPDRYALVITDHRMPGLSGIELIRMMRAAEMVLPVILSTGTSFHGSPLFEELGIGAFLHKPCTLRELTGAVKKLISSHDKGSVLGRNEQSSIRANS